MNEFMFGAQYYRAPTPGEEQWERDLKNFKKNGFNTIKIWAQWSTNNPARGVYDFSDIERLLNLAGRFDIRVIINVILDVMPAWFAKKFPESFMVTASGQIIAPRSTGWRQAGGAPGPCYHNPSAIKAKNDFLTALAKKFAGHSALECWDLWNEPELTCGIAREPAQDSMVCYCRHSQDAFIDWLRRKYGTVGALNKAWARSYRSFEEAQAPLSGQTYNDMLDWRAFFADTLTDDLKQRIQIVKAYDKQTPVMVHTVPLFHFNMINACADEYAMAKLCDWFGNSAGSDYMAAAMSVSAAAGKRTINSEIHAAGGSTFARPKAVTFNDIKKHIYIPLSKGIKGFLFWQYRAELLGWEAPAWGMTDLKGGDTPVFESAKRVNEILQKYSAGLNRAKPEKSKIAVIRDHRNEIFTWCADGWLQKYQDSIYGAFSAFHRLNYNVDVITAEQLCEKGLAQYSLVYYPLAYYQSEKVCRALTQYIRSGGMLVCEAFFGAYKAEDNMHSTTIPGYGFDKIFGVAEGESGTASSFMNAYGANWSREDEEKSIIKIKIDDGRESFNASGYYFVEELNADGGKTIGSFPGERSAVVESEYGAGRTIAAGSLMAAAYAKTGDEGTLRYFDMLAKKAGIVPACIVSQDKIRTDVLRFENGFAVIINNESENGGKIRCKLNKEQCASTLIDTDNAQEIKFKQNEFVVELAPGEIKLLIGEYAPAEPVEDESEPESVLQPQITNE